MVVPLRGNADDVIAWFRPEVPRTVQWAGDPRKIVTHSKDGSHPLPRKSFAVWSEMQRGRSEPWSAIDLEVAKDLHQLLNRAFLHHAEAQLAKLSAFDALTGLANRRMVEAELQLWRQRGTPETAALLFIDLDRFKTLNDTMGHGAGDECLIQLAGRLRALSPAGCLAGRLGGDEFVLFWPGATRQTATALADALVAEIARPFVLLGRDYYCGASVGVSCGDLAGMDAIMRQADAAMYVAKQQGGWQAVVFQEHLHTSVFVNMQTEQDLFSAIANSEMEVHYQPQVGVGDRRLRGFEALVRWRHPERGWVSPSDFIPRAEDAGLIARIGAWVLDQAIGRLAAWRLIEPELTMSINISPRQLFGGLLGKWLPAAMSAAGVTPEAICLEVTESALMHAESVHELVSLRKLGLKIAVDDFGTGQSSLAYLRGLPVDAVKIDRSFVTPLGTAKADRFFTAIVNLAHTIDLRTVAEGCETLDQWQVIQSAGCEVVQGWLVAPAMAPPAAERFLLAPPDWFQVARGR
jgi:diguanylate cyclase (GGDEF)-like protein